MPTLRRMHGTYLLGTAGSQAVTRVREQLGIAQPVRTGLVLGTGWRGTFRIEGEESMRLDNLMGFTGLNRLPEDDRRVCYGHVGDTPVIALRGRVNMFHARRNPDVPRLVRLQMELLIALGVRRVFLTSSAGPLRNDMGAGDIVIAKDFLTLFGPDMPLKDEKVCPSHAVELKDVGYAHRLAKAEDVAHTADEPRPKAHVGTYAMVPGPMMETTADKLALGRLGADVVGMSLIPECAIAAVHADKGVRALPLALLTSERTEASRDDRPPRYDRKAVHALADRHAGRLRRILARLVTDADLLPLAESEPED